MTIRKLVQYVRLLWSWLGTGVAKESIKFAPSGATPCIPAQKNCGASSLNGMANPWLLNRENQAGLANTLLHETRKHNV